MTSIRKRVGAIFCSFPASVEIVHDIMLQLLLKKDARCSIQSDSEILESVSVSIAESNFWTFLKVAKDLLQNLCYTSTKGESLYISLQYLFLSLLNLPSIFK